MLLKRVEQVHNVKSVRNISFFNQFHVFWHFYFAARKRFLLTFQQRSVALDHSVSITLVPGEHSKGGRSWRCYRRILSSSEAAASDCSTGLIKAFTCIISKDEGTASDKISNNSWDDVSGSRITVYLLWIWQSSRYCLRISVLSWVCRLENYIEELPKSKHDSHKNFYCSL